MKQETQIFLKFVDQELHTESFSIEKWKEYLQRLPHVYNGDITFRLLFDWHVDLAQGTGRAGAKQASINHENLIYTKQIELIKLAEYSSMDWIPVPRTYTIPRTHWSKKQVSPEIGGSLPNDLLFDHLGVDSYTNIESPDYIEADSGSTYSSQHGSHEEKNDLLQCRRDW